MKYSDEQLLKMWKDSGLSQKKFARSLNLNFNTVHWQIYHAKKKKEADCDTANEEKLYDEVVGNYREITSVNRRIVSVEDLIEYARINLDEWIVERAVVNKWEVGAKISEKSLRWEEGKILQGVIEDSGQIKVEPLFQVKLWLVKRHPDPVSPAVQPVVFNITKLPKPLKKESDMKVALILADPHFGFERDMHTGKLTPIHDRAALDIAMQLVGEVDEVVVTGDLLDLTEWTDKYLRGPEVYWTTQPAIIEASWWLGNLSTCADTKVLEGNHEDRLRKSILVHLIQAYGLKPGGAKLPALSVPSLLGLEEMGIEYVGNYPSGEVWLGDQAVCVHGDVVRSKSGGTVSSVVEDITSTTIFGHIHRIELATKTIHERKKTRTVSAFSPGCLCNTSGMVPGSKAKNNWQQGVGIILYNDEDHAIIPVPIKNGRTIVNGYEFVARDYKPGLVKDTGWEY